MEQLEERLQLREQEARLQLVGNDRSMVKRSFGRGKVQPSGRNREHLPPVFLIFSVSYVPLHVYHFLQLCITFYCVENERRKRHWICRHLIDICNLWKFICNSWSLLRTSSQVKNFWQSNPQLFVCQLVTFSLVHLGACMLVALVIFCSGAYFRFRNIFGHISFNWHSPGWVFSDWQDTLWGKERVLLVMS